MKEQIRKIIENKDIALLHSTIEQMNPKDIALMFLHITREQMLLVFRLLSKDKAVDTFSHMDKHLQETLIRSMTDKELKETINELFTDDTVDLIEEMPAIVVKRILSTIPKKNRKIVNEFLNYPEDSAGSIMTNEFVDLKENITVKDAFAEIRKEGTNKETIYTCYVLDDARKLVGLVSVRDLLLADPTTLIKDIMKTHIITATTTEDQEKVARRLHKYDFLALPVVDKENRLVGIITVDDAMDVLQAEHTEDLHKMAAMTPVKDSYFSTSVLDHAKHRIFWLIILMISAAVTGSIITNYENAFAAIPILVAFIPMLMGTGGNCGSQASTLIIRGLATDEIRTSDMLKVIYKELRVALLIGVSLAVINGIRVIIQYKDYMLALVVGITLIFTVIVAKLLGCTLPVLAKRLKLDPAIMAAPIISTIVDTLSVFIYFTVAMWLMNI